MSIEASTEGKALLAKLKSLIKDYAECMDAWEFIKETLQGQTLRHCFAWQTLDEPLPDGTGQKVETAKAVITTDRGLFEFAFSDRKRRYALTRLSGISCVEETRYTDSSQNDRPVPVIRAACHQNSGESRVYCVEGIEDCEDFRAFLRGLRQQLLK